MKSPNPTSSMEWSRKEFLYTGAMFLGGMLLAPFRRLPPPDDIPTQPIGRGRVTIRAIGRYSAPSLRSRRLGWLQRDEIVNLYARMPETDATPTRVEWYQLAQGFAHPAYLQRVDNAHLSGPAIKHIPPSGCLGEVTVPYTDSYRVLPREGWQLLYRLYFESLHWITGRVRGPDQRHWYRLTDDLLRVDYFVPAAHIRPLDRRELLPIHLEVPPRQKLIEISIKDQHLWAYEGDRLVLETPLSSGLPDRDPQPGRLPTETPTGSFHIQLKIPSRHMGEGELTPDREAYELPGVPWVCVFHPDGYALHGTYWHNNFGQRMSHGCVNLPNPAARWLYRWSTPIAGPEDWHRQGWGTAIEINA